MRKLEPLEILWVSAGGSPATIPAFFETAIPVALLVGQLSIPFSWHCCNYWLSIVPIGGSLLYAYLAGLAEKASLNANQAASRLECAEFRKEIES